MPDARSPSQLSIGEIVATIRHIIAEDEERGTAPIAPGDSVTEIARNEANPDRSAPDGDDDILELTQALNEDGSVRQLAPIGPSLRSLLRGDASSPATPETDASPLATAPEQRRIDDIASRAAATPAPRIAPASEKRPEHEPQLAGEQTVDAIIRALGAGGRTVEDIVREMLEPLLKSWLEEHLSAIVERQVRAELARTIEKPGF